jgi:hypothetical protein
MAAASDGLIVGFVLLVFLLVPSVLLVWLWVEGKSRQYPPRFRKREGRSGGEGEDRNSGEDSPSPLG